MSKVRKAVGFEGASACAAKVATIMITGVVAV